MQNILSNAFIMDSRTLLIVLFVGNLASALLIVSYHRIYLHDMKGKLSSIYAVAKLLQAAAFLLYIIRGFVSNFTSVIIGNLCLLIGHYFESVALQRIGNISNKRSAWILRGLLGISIAVFVAMELLYRSAANRIIYSSLGVFGLLLVSSIQFIVNQNANIFKRTMGVLYLTVLIFLLPRIIYTITTPEADIFTSAFIHAMTFLSMIVLLFYGQSFYLLMAKEKSDMLLKMQATTDALSGLLNRSCFLKKARREFESAKEQQSDIAVFFCDIDHFKKINDMCGHPFGDEVVKKCAEVLQLCMRKNDIVCRYGGDEFAIFAGVSDPKMAKYMAERILTKINAIRFEEYPDFSIALSIGVVCAAPQGNEMLEEYIAKADKALYVAKDTGRNGYHIYSESCP